MVVTCVQAVASPGFCVRGAHVWRRKKTENNKCMSYHPRKQPILLSMRHCIKPVCHSHTMYNNKMKLHESLKNTDTGY